MTGSGEGVVTKDATQAAQAHLSELSSGQLGKGRDSCSWRHHWHLVGVPGGARAEMGDGGHVRKALKVPLRAGSCCLLGTRWPWPSCPT